MPLKACYASGMDAIKASGKVKKHFKDFVLVFFTKTDENDLVEKNSQIYLECLSLC